MEQHRIMTSIVGACYHKGAEARLYSLKPKSVVLLVRNSKNKFDKNAIRVCTIDLEMLGFLPKEQAKKLAPIMDAKAHHVGGVVTDDGPPNLRVIVTKRR